MAVRSIVRTGQGGGQPFRWTRDAYHRLYEQGFIGPDERTELIDGEIINKMGQKRTHSLSLMRSRRAIEVAFGAGFHAQEQMPIALSDDGEPEPDICVLRGVPEDYRDIPTQADVLLVVEVSDSTLAFDRNRKGPAYAQAGITDYWIINLVDRQLEVYRNPAPSLESLTGFAYSSTLTFVEGESITPLFAPNSPVAVSDLLPFPDAG